MKINWKQKLTSRKFWAAVIGFVTAIMVAFGVNDLTIEQVVGLITAASTLIAYIIGEGMVDAARVKAETTTQDESDGIPKDVSGLSATGTNQAVKQLMKKEEK
jgi:uncharacterized membrane protein